AQRREAGQQRAALPRRIFASLRRALLHALPQLARELQALAEVGQRVVAEVEAIDQRIDAVVARAAAGIGVVGEGQQRVGGAAPGDARQLGLLLRRLDRLVGVLDRPVVVRADGGVVEAALLLAGQREVV